ncbi:hypothetical protein Pm5461_204 [Proteus phage vB_PmiM_Pm5461]|uniref:Uncharacterized protein n=1 Tax=Proteus phage vB_PmiM_Pm5461 TaxID=1636250 RepID=A0A0G2SSY1_9CAUD|nr:hypothetical protein AVT59_gp167 [Proteus phage vB_PmiM_Pm5461]AKA62070.1 hypothetical protein Pm5461_204 [Proteus phage vB_PmiM_Pm5461]
MINKDIQYDAVLDVVYTFETVDEIKEFLNQSVNGSFSLTGYISDDKKKRFYNGSYVTTSTIKSFEMINDKSALVKTRNTIYLVYFNLVGKH